MRIAELRAGGPAGLNVGDIAPSLDGIVVPNVDALRRQLTRESIGRELAIAIIRNGRFETRKLRPAPDRKA